MPIPWVSLLDFMTATAGNPEWRKGVHLASQGNDTWQLMWAHDDHGVRTFSRQGLLVAVLHVWMFLDATGVEWSGARPSHGPVGFGGVLF